jgi:hypothetical protein
VIETNDPGTSSPTKAATIPPWEATFLPSTAMIVSPWDQGFV